jgi:hypothetical protein
MSQPENLDIEAPEADAVEQAMIAGPSEDDDSEERLTLPESIEAPEWDALEQARTVHVEDDYR